MNRFGQLLPLASVFACAVAQLPLPAAFGIGLSMSCLSYWLNRKWPDAKPAYMPVISRPEAKTLQKELCSIFIVAGAMIVGGLICIFLLPEIMQINIWTFFWPPMGAHFIGQGLGTFVFGRIAAPKDVVEHNAWLAKMGSNPPQK